MHANGENDNTYARGAYRLFERGGHYRQPKGFIAGEIRDYVPILRDFTDVLASFVVCRAVRFRSFFGTGVDGMFKICKPFCLYSTPSVTVCHLPYILTTKHRKRDLMPFYLIIYRMRWIVFVLLPCRVQWHCGELCKQYREETEETVVSEERA